MSRMGPMWSVIFLVAILQCIVCSVTLVTPLLGHVAGFPCDFSQMWSHSIGPLGRRFDCCCLVSCKPEHVVAVLPLLLSHALALWPLRGNFQPWEPLAVRGWFWSGPFALLTSSVWLAIQDLVLFTTFQRTSFSPPMDLADCAGPPCICRASLMVILVWS